MFPAPQLVDGAGAPLEARYSGPEQALLLAWATAVKKGTSTDELQVGLRGCGYVGYPRRRSGHGGMHKLCTHATAVFYAFCYCVALHAVPLSALPVPACPRRSGRWPPGWRRCCRSAARTS